ncbi:MAG: arginine--tRNA ligase [Bacteroidia bacterium]|nr:arginine--tRNA ligase [Bacteroidia bacterium]
MSHLFQEIQTTASAIAKEVFGVDIDPSELPLQETRKEFDGDFTMVVFPLTKHKLGSPQQIAETLGIGLIDRLSYLTAFNVIKGFLNLSLSAEYWVNFVADQAQSEAFLSLDHGQGQTVVVEYCSPNTNKPLHLGHLRNIILGYSLTEILRASGYHVVPTCLFNDRGTNISKSMVAWLAVGKEETPADRGVKGDKLVGDYYVAFNDMLKEQAAPLLAQGIDKREADNQTAVMQAVHDMTVKWEQGDPEVVSLWKKMNGWFYEAVQDTFSRMGISFEKFYYESEVYLKGKEAVAEGLEKGVFTQAADGSVEIDLTEDKLDKKTLLRGNGTSLYITQDLAIAADKYAEFEMDKSIYVVGNEQEYHFQVLFKILEKLEKPFANGLYHLSYGMVELPTGKMKSREGTIVEADDLLDEMRSQAKEETSQNLAKVQEMSTEELELLYETLGQGALKYYLVKVDPRKKMLFDPKESIELKGNTGPFIQYSYARIQAVKRKAATMTIPAFHAALALEDHLMEEEKTLSRLLFRYPAVLKEAGDSYNPALLANYAYEVAKEFNRFYQQATILKADAPNTSAFRLMLADFAGRIIEQSLRLLGIGVPSRM